jgi:hygromycin-B 4-O-kinase
MPKTSHSLSPILARLSRDFDGVGEFVPLTEGLESQAYRFRSSGDDFVVRINPAAASFEKDFFVAERFAGPALPIPAIVLVDDFEGDAICVSRAAAGVTLQDLGAGAFALGGAVSTVLDAMAAADVSELHGAGPFDAKGVGRCASWQFFLRACKELDWSGVSLAEEAGPILAAVNRLAEGCPEERRLVHGDFGSNNVLCDAGAITGVIDWSEAMIGDPLYDVANLLFWRSWLECMEQQCRYFEMHEPHRLASSERLTCYQLHIGLMTLFEAARDGDREVLLWALGRCREILG